MEYRDLRDFIGQLERQGDLKRITRAVSTDLEITEISDRVLRAGGPALLFENAGDSKIPLLANLFGTEQRVAQALGEENAANLREVGKLLAFLKEPAPPKGFKEAMKTLPIYRKILDQPHKSATLFISEGDALDMKTNVLTHAFIDGRMISLETHQTKLYKRYQKKLSK